MKELPTPRLTRDLLDRACMGNGAALDGVRRRVERIRGGSRLGLAGLIGEMTPEQAVVAAWIESGLVVGPLSQKAAGVSGRAQDQVFRLVYPLVAHLGAVTARVALRVASSPSLLKLMLGISREILGAPQVVGMMPGVTPRPLSPFRFVANDSLFAKVTTAEARRADRAVRLLVEAGADLELRDPDDGTPLLCVARFTPSRLQVIESLVACGANIFALNAGGENVLHQPVWRDRGAGASGDTVANLAHHLVRILPADALQALFRQRRASDGLRPHEMRPESREGRILTAAAERVGV